MESSVESDVVVMGCMVLQRIKKVCFDSTDRTGSEQLEKGDHVV